MSSFSVGSEQDGGDQEGVRSILEVLEMKPTEARLRWFKLGDLGRRRLRLEDGRREVWRRSREGDSWMK